MINIKKNFLSFGAKLLAFAAMFVVAAVSTENAYAYDLYQSLPSSLKDDLSEYDWDDGWSQSFTYTCVLAITAMKNDHTVKYSKSPC